VLGEVEGLRMTASADHPDDDERAEDLASEFRSASGLPSPSLMYAVKQVELAVRAHLDELLRPSGVTATQFTALTVLARRDRLTSAELARNSFITAQSMMDVINVLERRGLIVRTRDPAHARRLLTSLTEKGWAFLDEYGDRVRRLEEKMLMDLTSDERWVLRDLLNRCRAALATQPAR
jgi:DNA-binding MarR family transcriptional regulator